VIVHALPDDDRMKPTHRLRLRILRSPPRSSIAY
jgi:hypothetical protein